MQNIPDIQLALASLISLGTSSGSGFVYRSESFTYLVTAKHVLFNEDGNLRTNEIDFSCQTREITDENVVRFRIELDKVTIRSHKKNDVAIVQFGEVTNLKKSGEGNILSIFINYLPGVENLEKGVHNPTLCNRTTVGLLTDVLISNDIYVCGYPTSLGIESSKQFDFTKPLLRKGIVANIYKETQTIILDCPVYGGNSGAPVIQVTEKNGKKKFIVIGVISQYIPFVQRWKNERDKLIHLEYLNSGYSVATSFEAVLELINSIEKK